jgi:hypothetical protein
VGELADAAFSGPAERAMNAGAGLIRVHLPHYR